MIHQGMNMRQFSDILMECFEPQLREAMKTGRSATPFPQEEVNRRLQRLPNKPDEKLN